jgi:hypothetical protein
MKDPQALVLARLLSRLAGTLGGDAITRAQYRPSFAEFRFGGHTFP